MISVKTLEVFMMGVIFVGFYILASRLEKVIDELKGIKQSLEEACYLLDKK